MLHTPTLHPQKYKTLIAYDGTGYFGWQATQSGPSIQGTLQEALFRLTQEEVIPEAASRTDRGVHAEGQCICFELKKPFDPDTLYRALNALLPPDIRVLSVERALPTFHPTLEAKSKEYIYRFSLGPVQYPNERLYAWHIPQRLCFSSMQKGADLLIGEKNFTAFSNEKKENPICHLYAIEFLENKILLRGNRFLYKMARNLVGTLVDVGKNKISYLAIPDIFSSQDRRKSGVSAPAHGLFLHRVIY